MLDIQAQHTPIRDRIREAIEGVLIEGIFILGPKVEHFERRPRG